jgi:hypothetical protein
MTFLIFNIMNTIMLTIILWCVWLLVRDIPALYKEVFSGVFHNRRRPKRNNRPN